MKEGGQVASLFYSRTPIPCRSCRRLRSFEFDFFKNKIKRSQPSAAPTCVRRMTHQCGTIPATFSHTRIDHTHERPPPPPQTCAQQA
ncbi:hypothetical protein PkP19E3_05075 [Pseudomonas koreensis]|nr:hypothetical protein PkP19E3_05075 [Pseudomonas koreensis]